VYGLRGLIQGTENVQGHNVSVPDFQITQLADVDSNVDVDATGTGRLYGFWVDAGDADVIVQITDNNIVIACAKVLATRQTEAYYFDNVDGIGLPYGTDLEVNAVLASDGTTPAATTARPDVVVIWGDDAINTTDANLINVNFG
jgi:hypothetical protein